MVPLLAGSPEQHMQGIADDLRHRTIVRKHDIRHTHDVVIEKWSKDIGFECLHERRKIGDVGEKHRNLAALTTEINRVRVVGKPFS